MYVFESYFDLILVSFSYELGRLQLALNDLKRNDPLSRSANIASRDKFRRKKYSYIENSEKLSNIYFINDYK